MAAKAEKARRSELARERVFESRHVGKVTSIREADVRVVFTGSFFLFRPVSGPATAWIEENAPDAMWLGDAIVVEGRYACDLIEGMRGDGLIVEGER